MQQFRLSFNIKAWFYWGAYYCTSEDLNEQTDKQHDLSSIPAMQRRRLPEVAKRLHQFAQQMADENTPVIYASHNGEIAQTLAIIRSFEHEVSPAKFSLSVHNAIAGLLSVLHNNTQSYQAIDSLSGLLESALVEGAGLLTQYPKVAIVYYDEDLPLEFMSADATAPRPLTRVFAMTMTQGQDYNITKITPASPQAPDAVISEFNAVNAVVDFLRSPTPSITIAYPGSVWQWSRDVC